MNKSNAHLYLPLVQALAEGKPLQFNAQGDEWRDVSDYGLDFTCNPSRYRIKPLEWPPIPEGCSLHNPDNLTPEQVGDGHRLLVDAEITGNEMDGLSMWDGYNKKWGDIMELWTTKDQTFRLPISTPFPCGSRIVDGKLVKSWFPKFSVGQKVRVKASGINAVVELVLMDRGLYQLEDRESTFDENELELVPWTLSRNEVIQLLSDSNFAQKVITLAEQHLNGGVEA